jgi:alpha-glucoside transport system substrate-binding protein
MGKKLLVATSSLVGASLLLGACTPTTEESDSKSGETQTVTLVSPMTGEQQQQLEQVLAPFTEATGIEVAYEGVNDFATVLPVRVASGNPPDVAIFPQPGLMERFAEQEELVPLEQFMSPAQLEKAYPQQWLDLGTVNNQVYGLWYSVSVKSLVWYNPEQFQKQGYSIPETWQEMMQLSQQIVDDGKTPWCLGVESGETTGWVGTDWIEDIMLRTAGPQVYDKWVNHEIPFTHPAVKKAFQRFGEIARNSEYVVGGTVGVLSIPYGDSVNGLFQSPPRCYLHRQGTFIASFFPGTVTLGEDADVFPLPPIEAGEDIPLLVAGDVVAMFNNTPEARALMKYLASPKPHEAWARLGGYLSPHRQVSLNVYPNEVTKRQAELLKNADTIRFDGSDLMPSSVGTGTFWSGMVNYLNGKDLDRVLQNIEDSWPEES